MRAFLICLALAIILAAVWVIEEVRADRAYRNHYKPTVPKSRLPPID